MDTKVVTPVERNALTVAAIMEEHELGRLRRVVSDRDRRRREGLVMECGLDLGRLDVKRPTLMQETEQPAMTTLEVLPDIGAASRWDQERRVGSFVSDPQPPAHSDVLAWLINGKFGSGCSLGCAKFGGSGCRVGCFELAADGAVVQGGGVGKAHTVGGENPGERVEQHRSHPEVLGDSAGELTGCRPETGECAGGDIVAPLDGDCLDGGRHIGDRDLEEPFGHIFGCVADFRRQLLESRFSRLKI